MGYWATRIGDSMGLRGRFLPGRGDDGEHGGKLASWGMHIDLGGESTGQLGRGRKQAGRIWGSTYRGRKVHLDTNSRSWLWWWAS